MTNREDGYMADHCTNWANYDVPTIWSTVSDEGDAVSYAQVTAWRETSEAIDKHAATLRAARDELMAGWPPTSSSASQEFLDQIDTALGVMDHYSRVASINSSALHGIVQSLNEAKTAIQPIYEEWMSKEAAQRSKSQLDRVLDTATFWSDENAWRKALGKRAVAIMVASDTAVSAHRQQMQAIDPYLPPKSQNIQPLSNVGGNNSSSNTGLNAPVTPPNIPPITLQSSTEPTNPRDILTAAPASHSILPTISVQPSPTPDMTNTGILGYPYNPAANGRNGIPRSAGTQPKSLTNPGELEAEFTRTSGSPQDGVLVGPDGVIGATPVTGGQPSRRTPAHRANGVIGGGGIEPTRGRGSQNKYGSTEIVEQDDSWVTAKGVPAVIAANPEIRVHVPGSGVLGIDR